MSALLEELSVQREVARLRQEPSLPPAPPLPVPPVWEDGSCLATFLECVQVFINSFEYNYSGMPFVPIKRMKDASHVWSVSKKLIQEALPIQCVEGVFLGTFLTAGVERLERIPISFKTKFLRGTVHRHIVLAVRIDRGKWGAVGISRRSNLMDKRFCFDTLADLVEEYRRSYEACYHKLLTVYIGLPMPQDLVAENCVVWRAVKIRVTGRDSVAHEALKEKVNKFVRNKESIASTHFGIQK